MSHYDDYDDYCTFQTIHVVLLSSEMIYKTYPHTFNSLLNFIT